MKNRQILISLVVLAIVGGASSAEPITVTNKHGVVYKNITIIKKDRDAILYRSEAGGGRLKAVDMGEELQTRFGFDPATVGKIADEEKQKAAERDRAYNEAAAKAKAARAAQTQENATLGPIRHQLIQESRKIDGYVLQKISRGLIVLSGVRVPQGTSTKAPKPGAVFVGRCLLVNHPSQKTMTENSKISLIAYPEATYEYESVGAGIKSVAKFNCNLEELVRRKGEGD